MEKARQRRAFAYVLPETRQPTRTVFGDEGYQAIEINLITPRLGLLSGNNRLPTHRSAQVAAAPSSSFRFECPIQTELGVH
jgi:hypothetical protein